MWVDTPFPSPSDTHEHHRTRRVRQESPRHGRGVFAGRPYRKGEVIEVCPVIRLPAASEGAAGGGLEHYVFQ